MNEPAQFAKVGTESLVAELVDDFVRRLDDGEQPSIEEYARRHPQIAEALRRVLPAVQVMGTLSVNTASLIEVSGAESRASGHLGDYRIIREIGRGGMGVVYEAEQVSLGRKVALKVLPFAAVLDNRQLQRFQSEAQAAARLHHTHIVPVFSVGCERGVHYYAMQYIEGHPLSSVIHELRQLSGLHPIDQTEGARAVSETTSGLAPGQSLPASFRTFGGSSAAATLGDDSATSPLGVSPTGQSTKSPEYLRSVAKLGVQAAEALEHAHQQGIIHRDVKPSNLLLDTQGDLWITDFGLAHCQTDAAQTLTIPGDLLGTIRYMSPEQALAKRVVIDHRTDIYSLGVTLYELLTLEPPFTGQDRQELLRQISFEEPQRLRRVNKAIPVDLETIVLKAMARGPAGRYDTAQDMADDLQRFLEDKPIRAKPPGPWVRLGKWTRRHKALSVAVAAAVLVASVAGTTATVRHYLRLSRLNTAAQHGLTDARLAMAQADYADAQRELTGVKAQLAGAPALWGQYEPQVEDLLRQAELRLRLDRFEALADEARFSAQISICILLPFRWTGGQLAEHLSDARRRCSDALAVFDVVENDRWLADVEPLLPDPGELKSLKDTVAEMLLLLAHVEFQLGEVSALAFYLEDVSGASASRTRRAIELLDQVEEFSPKLRALYEYRSTYWEALGEREAARADAERAEGIMATSWVDHWLLAQKLWLDCALADCDPTQAQAMSELEAALALKVDSYWTWYAWASAAWWVEYPPHQIHQAMSICIGLRPQEAAAWIGRGWEGREPGDAGLEAALVDLAKGLSLTTDPGLRAKACLARSVILAQLGRTEEALHELDEATRLYSALPPHSQPSLGRHSRDELEIGRWQLSPDRMEAALPYLSRLIEMDSDSPGALAIRAQWYKALGRPELAQVDAHRVLDTCRSLRPTKSLSHPASFERHMERIEALERIEQWREVVRAYLEMETLFARGIYPNYPNLANAYRRLGPDYLESGRFDEDLEPYEEAAKIHIKSGIARVLVAADAVEHDPVIALPLALQVVQAKPDNRHYRNTLGITYYRLGRYEEAIETLQASIDRLGGEEGSAEELFFLAMAEWQRGNRDQARQLYDEGVDWMAQNQSLATRTDQLKACWYEAAQLMGIPGAPIPAGKD